EVGVTSSLSPCPAAKRRPAGTPAGQDYSREVIGKPGLRAGSSEPVAQAHQPGAAPLHGLERAVLAAGVGAVARVVEVAALQVQAQAIERGALAEAVGHLRVDHVLALDVTQGADAVEVADLADEVRTLALNRKSTRLNSSHVKISYAV